MKYQFDRVINDRWSVWYKELPKRGARIGVYKIFDLFAKTRTYRFALRYKPRENQTQEASDIAILMNGIHNFYKKKVFMGTKNESGSRGYKRK